jgi:hypothetical protein
MAQPVGEEAGLTSAARKSADRLRGGQEAGATFELSAGVDRNRAHRWEARDQEPAIAPPVSLHAGERRACWIEAEAQLTASFVSRRRNLTLFSSSRRFYRAEDAVD